VHTYRICGLSVASEIVLPGLIAGEPDSIPQVTIRRGPVPEELPDAEVVGPTWQIAGKRFLLNVPNVARFIMRNGEQIVFAPESDASAEDVPIFILGTVFGILLHQREQIVLHASAVEVNGRAVLFCGPSGAGKSTLAAALVQRGYRLITDDLCAITLPLGGAPIVHPDGRQLKLWAEAIDKLKLEEARGQRVRRCLEKFYVEPRDAAAEPLPLGAIYALGEARHFGGQGIKRPNVVDCALLLRNHGYRPLLIARLQQKEHYFLAAARIADKSGIFSLKRPLDFAAMAEVVLWLEAHWRDVGVMEKAA
jgi:HPr Serine kinase C-terminal domain